MKVPTPQYRCPSVVCCTIWRRRKMDLDAIKERGWIGPTSLVATSMTTDWGPTRTLRWSVSRPASDQSTVASVRGRDFNCWPALSSD